MDASKTVPKSNSFFPPSIIVTSISLTMKGVKNTPLDGFYQMKIPSEVILIFELIVPENAKDYSYPDSVL